MRSTNDTASGRLALDTTSSGSSNRASRAAAEAAVSTVTPQAMTPSSAVAERGSTSRRPPARWLCLDDRRACGGQVAGVVHDDDAGCRVEAEQHPAGRAPARERGGPVDEHEPRPARPVRGSGLGRGGHRIRLGGDQRTRRCSHDVGGVGQPAHPAPAGGACREPGRPGPDRPDRAAPRPAARALWPPTGPRQASRRRRPLGRAPVTPPPGRPAGVPPPVSPRGLRERPNRRRRPRRSERRARPLCPRRAAWRRDHQLAAPSTSPRASRPGGRARQGRARAPGRAGAPRREPRATGR